MQNTKFKTKDMIIAVFCTILAILSIVFYFLPAFSVEHTPSIGMGYETLNYSALNLTQAVFTNTKMLGSDIVGLLYIKDVYGMPIFLAGILMPIALLCIILTTVFAYLSWLKSDNFKKYCFLFGLVGMIFATVTLISTWFIALQIKNGNTFSYFYVNVKGNISYGSFVSLIISFVVAIIACAYNYFIDSEDDEDDEEDDEEEEDEEEEEIVVPKKKVVTRTTTTTKKTTTTTKTATKSSTPKTPTKGTSTTRFIKKS